MSNIVMYPEKAETMGFLINQEREKLGLQQLYTFPYLKKCAEIRAEESTVYFSHTRPDGYSYFNVVDKSIIPWVLIGEILAGGKENAPEALQQWKDSPKHWQTITNPDYTHIGCGVCYNPDGDGGWGWYWCAFFTAEWNPATYEGQYLPENLEESPENPGAFENAVNLRKVIIPESVVQIGGKSFSGTLLKSVQIAENCRYSATSFPEDCVINFYK